MIFKGIPVSPGIAIGKVFVMEKEAKNIHKRSVPQNEIKSEVARFRKAIVETKRDIIEIEKKVKREIGSKPSQIFEGYRMFLNDKVLISETEDIIRKQNVNAEFAFSMQLKKVISDLSALKNDYLKERARDIAELGHRIMAHLLSCDDEIKWDEIPSDSVVVAHNITPADTTNMKSNAVISFVTDVGGKTSHTAILARSLEIPAVTGLRNISSNVRTGQPIIVDGASGIVITDPDEETVINYKRERKKFLDEKNSLRRLIEMPTVTTDGRNISLMANIEIPEEIPTALAYGAEGIGLYRSEYIFINSDRLPTEDEQYEKYASVCRKMLPHSVIIRTFDIGADKMAKFIELPEEPNPIMGTRAVRLSLKLPEVFKTQIRALLRASEIGNLKVMIPMITNVLEIKKVKMLFEEAKRELKDEGKPFNENLPFGAMIEIPSAALTVDLIAREVDFLSIGTNDLIQYTLAVDRVNENVGYLYEPMNLSILRLIKWVVIVAHQLGKPVSMCGEMASDPSFTKILVGMDLDELSMSSIAIPKIKKIIRTMRYKEAKEFVRDFVSPLV
ncbi:MAG: phosphoenolpyruvate--protein phosphotransferase [Elusimicrobia bacterium]|nr:phosphoenolpyruvate--protein phosphotransferase [Elusimicrobiota bacterium]